MESKKWMEGFPEKDKVQFKRVRARRGMRDEAHIILYTSRTQTSATFTYRHLHTEVCLCIETPMKETCFYHIYIQGSTFTSNLKINHIKTFKQIKE